MYLQLKPMSLNQKVIQDLLTWSDWLDGVPGRLLDGSVP